MDVITLKPEIHGVKELQDELDTAAQAIQDARDALERASGMVIEVTAKADGTPARRQCSASSPREG